MTIVKSRQSFVGRSAITIGAILLGVSVTVSTGSAQQTSQRERQLQQQLDDGAKAQDQRSQQLKDATNSQQQLLNYQIRKAQRTARESQCRAAGLPPNC